MKNLEGKDIQFGELFTELNILPLKDGEIHLWGIAFDASSHVFEACSACLTNQERERISYYNFKRVQDDYIMSQGGLRLLLSQYLNLEPQQIQLRKHAKGKPYSADDNNLCFNLSNSGDYAIYAFSRAGEVGIDLEEIRQLPDIDELIEKNFTEKERQYIHKQKTERFFQFWTIKEAYLKAIGEGMRLTPDKLEFSINNGNFELEAVNGIFEQEDWLFKEITPDEKYVGTLTYLGEKTKVGEMRILR